jgi:hypothetical protein
MNKTTSIFINIISLYLLLLAVSALTICITLGVPMWEAIRTATIGCVLKTIVAYIHAETIKPFLLSRK